MSSGIIFLPNYIEKYLYGTMFISFISLFFSVELNHGLVSYCNDVSPGPNPMVGATPLHRRTPRLVDKLDQERAGPKRVQGPGEGWTKRGLDQEGFRDQGGAGLRRVQGPGEGWTKEGPGTRRGLDQ